MTMEAKVHGAYAQPFNVFIHDNETINAEARLAVQFIERWAMVAGIPDGEDSAGRAKCRLMEPNEIVSRACETAEVLMQAFRERGWTILLPTMAEAEAEVAKKRKEKEPA